MHLAQLNIATLRQPIDHPDTADFTNALDGINGLAEASPGFVWRLVGAEGNATDIILFDNPLTIINLTVWESVEALKAFAYRGAHAGFVKRRGEWFEPGSTRTALWWIPAGTVPTTHDAINRLTHLETHGSSDTAFLIGQVHQPPTH